MFSGVVTAGVTLLVCKKKHWGEEKRVEKKRAFIFKGNSGGETFVNRKRVEKEI